MAFAASAISTFVRLALRTRTVPLLRSAHIHDIARKRDKPSLQVPAKVYPVRKFFANYPEFDYNPQAPFLEEFKRMDEALGWERDERKQAREKLHAAMVKQFNSMYGTKANDLTAWRLLCSALGMDPVPKDIKTCRMKVEATHVNMVDFLEAPLWGMPVRTFESEGALSRYTKAEEKYFLRRLVAPRSLLGRLLRRILNPPPESSHRSGSKSKSARKEQARKRSSQAPPPISAHANMAREASKRQRH